MTKLKRRLEKLYERRPDLRRQLEAGIEVEYEHTTKKKEAKKIALDHLDEDPDYYKDWKKKEQVLFKPKVPKTLKKSESYAYAGPMSVADINIASWNEFFAEGGNLNQPTWLQKPRLSAIRKKFEFLSRYHK